MRGLQLEWRDSAPPLLVGGHGCRLAEIAARHADAVNVEFHLSPREWGTLGARLLASESGRTLLSGP